MTQILRKSDVLEAEVGADFIVLNPGTLVYYEFNDVGQRIWQLLAEGPRPVSALIEQLLAEFDVDETRCRAAVEAFIADGSAKGLLQLEEE